METLTPEKERRMKNWQEHYLVLKSEIQVVSNRLLDVLKEEKEKVKVLASLDGEIREKQKEVELELLKKREVSAQIVKEVASFKEYVSGLRDKEKELDTREKNIVVAEKKSKVETLLLEDRVKELDAIIGARLKSLGKVTILEKERDALLKELESLNEQIVKAQGSLVELQKDLNTKAEAFEQVKKYRKEELETSQEKILALQRNADGFKEKMVEASRQLKRREKDLQIYEGRLRGLFRKFNLSIPHVEIEIPEYEKV